MKYSYNLIQATTTDELILSGLYQEGNKNKEAVILIHGFTGDFYTHPFYHAIAQKLKEHDQALILAQTRGTGLRTEFIKTNGDGIYLGSFAEVLEEAHLDISAFVKFLQDQGYQKITLAGHSLGTVKVVRYLFEGELKQAISKLVLLAPFDKNILMPIKAGDKWDEFLKVAQDKIAQGKGEETVPVPEYEDYPITWKTFLSWYNREEISCMFDFFRANDYYFPILQQINIPVLAILGDQDEYTTYPDYGVSPEQALQVLAKYIPNSQTFLLNNCQHVFSGCEDELAQEIQNFLSS